MKPTKFFHQKEHDNTKDDWKIVLYAGIAFFAVLFIGIIILIILTF